ncbi:MAG: ATP-binding protein [Imperialibacter sp.]
MLYNYKASCSTDKLQEIRQFVDDLLRQHGLSDVESHKVVLAVDEVCANLIIHSHGCDANESIEISVEFKADKTTIFEIKDHGEAFNMAQYKEPSLSDIIRAKKKGGIGLMLVNRIMDKIEFYQSNGYNVCRLTKDFKK